MAHKIKQAGFTVIEAVLVIVTLAAIAAGGYWVWKHKDNGHKASNTTTVQQDSTKSKAAPATNDASQLNSDSKTVDSTDTNVGTNDAAQMNSQATPFY